MRTLKQELWPYRVRVDKSQNELNPEIEYWLHDMGKWKSRWNVVYGYSYCDFYFRDVGDATLFSLKWL